MPTKRHCAECGTPLPPDVAEGSCPVCALRGALELSSAPTAVPVTERPGDRIGRYKLLEKIGEGGYGVVYMAEQAEPIRRRVALKVVKLGMDTKQVIARFEAERQALALMDHPNIARVFDAGATDTGRPYFVMELVRGIRITDYCDQHNLTTRERLELFMQVCHAVQHAHQKGIIHRDIKPSNILVTLHDGVPVPKVIDFGIAKATGQVLLTDKTVFTAFQQFIGTPAYMSPEQAELSGMDIDTRSDIYTLGVLLYELLTGRMPFEPGELLHAGFDEMRRLIREKEPLKPSTRLSSLSVADLTTVASRRQTEPPKLLHLVRGDLDWIVMKCLEKDRTRRYETANGLEHDLERHLNDEPVMAAAPSAFYQMRKFVRRHRFGLITAAALVLLLVAGVVVSTWQTARATRLEKRALVVATFLQETLTGVTPEEAKGKDTKLMLEILDKAAARVDKELKDQPSMEAWLRKILGEVYFGLGQYPKAELHLRRALELLERTLGKEHPSVREVLSKLSLVLREQGRLPEAETMSRAALAMERRLLGDEQLGMACCLNDLALVLEGRGKLAEATTMYRKSLAMHRELGGSEHPHIPNVLEGLATVLLDQGKLTEAETMSRAALAMRQKLLGKEHPDVAASLSNLAEVLSKQGKLAEAETMFRQALAMQKRLLGKEHLDVAGSLNNLAGVLVKQGKLKEAEAMFVQTLAMQKRLLGEEHPDVGGTLNNLAIVLEEQGKLTEAEAMYREALAMKKRLLGNEHPEVATTLGNLAVVLAKQGKLTEAEATFREALVMKKRLLGNEHPEVATTLGNLAGNLCEQGKLAEAEAMFRQALSMQRRLLGEEQPDVAGSLNNLAAVLDEQGKLAEAEAMYREALAMTKRLLGNEHPEVATTLGNLAVVLYKKRELKEAEAMCREAVAMRRKLLGNEHPDVASSLNNLAEVFAAQGKLAQAETMHREALAMRKRLLCNEHPDVVKSLYNLRAVLQTQGKLAEAERLVTDAAYAELGLVRVNRDPCDFKKDIEALAEAIKKNEQTNGYLVARSFLLGQQGQWRAAVSDLAKVAELDPKMPTFSLGPLLVEIGDQAAYTSFRRRMSVRFGGSDDPPTAAETAMGLLLQPAETGLVTASQLAETAIARGTNDIQLPYFQLVKGLAEYRQGRFASAVDWARRSIADSGTNITTAVAAEAVLAMAQRKLDRAADSSQSLAHAAGAFETKLPRLKSGNLGENWPQWLIARILLREARDLIEKK